MSTTADPAEALRYVFIHAPRCPACASTSLKVYKSIKSEDGQVITRYTFCKDCRHRFLVISD